MIGGSPIEPPITSIDYADATVRVLTYIWEGAPQVTVASALDCVRACDDTPTCFVAVFTPQTGDRTAACALYESAGTPVLNNFQTSYDYAIDGQGALLAGYSLSATFTTADSANTLGACETACFSDSSCTAAVFASSFNSCNLVPNSAALLSVAPNPGFTTIFPARFMS